MSTPNVRRSGRQSARECRSAKQAAEVSKTAVKPNSLLTHDAAVVNAAQREAMIRRAAYFRAESRGFGPGEEVDDWLAAEAEVDRILANGELPALCGD